MSAPGTVITSSTWWTYPALTFISVLLWYLTDTVDAKGAPVHLMTGLIAMLAVSLAAITNIAWRWLPANVFLVVTLTLVSIVACVLVFAAAAPFFVQWFDSVSPTVKMLTLGEVRVVLLWGGLLSASIFLMAHEYFQRTPVRTSLLVVMGVSFALLLLAIFFGAVG